MQPPRGALLWRSLRLYQVYGANTDVGKTIFSTILCKGVKRLRRNDEVAFLKPISTGPEDEADQRCMRDPHILMLRHQHSHSDHCNRRPDPVAGGNRT
jgi:dethiobiotin synthetase/adenosylmethionine--8-amino-7-oxononanoate aminotransferase